MENQTGYAEYLEHHGVKGQRWGVRRTPEQLGHRRKKDTTIYGSLPNEKGKSAASRFLDNRRESAKKKEQIRKEADRKKMMAERAANARKAKAAKKEALKKAEEKAKEDAKRREKILKDPTLLFKHKDEFSTDEINKAVQRFDMEKRLQELSLAKLSRGEAYIRAAVKYADASVDAYNMAARVVNTFGGTDLPIISKGNKPKDKTKDKTNEDEKKDASQENQATDSQTGTSTSGGKKRRKKK